jgi:hypothetical protein
MMVFSGVEARYRAGHGKVPAILNTAEDVDVLIDSLLSGPPDENLAELHSTGRTPLPSGFPDHGLMVGADQEASVGVLEFMDASGNWASVGKSGSRQGVVYYAVGTLPNSQLVRKFQLTSCATRSRNSCSMAEVVQPASSGS